MPRGFPRRHRWAPKVGTRTDGYRSKFEATIAEQLKGLPVLYETETIHYQIFKFYKPDFKVGSVLIEAKGYFDAADRTKHLLVKAQNPGLDIRFVFQNAKTKISSRSKMTYGDWATRHGFKWAHACIPQEWLDELATYAEPRP